jgi:hypothetical protein
MRAGRPPPGGRLPAAFGTSTARGSFSYFPCITYTRVASGAKVSSSLPAATAT